MKSHVWRLSMVMKKNLMALLGIAFIVATVATGLFYGLVAGKLNRAVTSEPSSIVVAARELKPGAVLTASDVKLAPKSGADVLVNGFSAAKEVEGLVVMTAVDAGQPLTRSVLVSRESSHGAALGVPPGLRAVSIHVTDSAGVVRMLKRGSRVDTQLVYTRSKKPGSSTVVQTILQDLEVLGVEAEPEVTPGRPPLPVVTLLAEPEEADALAVADAAARIRLLLRHPLDDQLTKRPPVVLAGVMKSPPKQDPQRLRTSHPGGSPASQAVAKPVRTATVHSEP